MSYDRELLKGSTDPLLLALLGEEPMYGYQVAKELERRSKGFFQFGEGTLYSALHRLENEGLVESKWQSSPTGHQRRYYSLTDKGNRHLDARLSQWRGFSRAVRLVLASNRS